MLHTIVTFLAGALLGAILGIFFYRNNHARASKVADSVDDIVDTVKNK